MAYNSDINVFSALIIHKNYKYIYNLHYIIKYRPVRGHKLALNLNLVLDLTCPKPALNLNLP